MTVKFQVFRGTFTTWERLFMQAAEFAAQIGKDDLINISHSQDNVEGIVTVWYWSNE